MLGRFSQADTLIPEPGNPLSWDQYVYVLNNPVRYTDPSGNWTCYLEGEDGQCLAPGSPGQPTILDLGRLSEDKHDATDISARQLYLTYLSMWDARGGWWWDELGGRDGFTLGDFLSLWGREELSGMTRHSAVLAEAGYRKFVEWGHMLGQGTDVYGLLDRFAEFSGSAGRAISHGTLPEPEQQHHDAITSIFGNLLLKPDPSWRTGFDPARPYDWGNVEMLSAYQKSVYEDHTSAMFVVIGDPLKDPNWFFVPSGCAVHDWPQGDLSHCPPG